MLLQGDEPTEVGAAFIMSAVEASSCGRDGPRRFFPLADVMNTAPTAVVLFLPNVVPILFH